MLHAAFVLFRLAVRSCFLMSSLCSEQITLCSSVTMISEQGMKEYYVPAERTVGELLTSVSGRLFMLGIPCLYFSLAVQVATHSGLALLTLDSLLACLALPEMLQRERSWAQFDVAVTYRYKE